MGSSMSHILWFENHSDDSLVYYSLFQVLTMHSVWLEFVLYPGEYLLYQFRWSRRDSTYG